MSYEQIFGCCNTYTNLPENHIFKQSKLFDLFRKTQDNFDRNVLVSSRVIISRMNRFHIMFQLLL